MGSAGVIAAATIASIAGADVSGRTALAGVPAGVFQLGTALLALPWSLATDALGRRGGLALGASTGVLGAIGSVVAVVLGNFALLVLSLLIMGSSQAAFRLGRFAAAEVNPLRRRGRAVATVVLGGAVGSVAGPLLIAPAGRFATSLGVSELAGVYAVVGVLFAIGAALFAMLLRPDPLVLGRRLAELEPEAVASGPSRSLRELAADPGVRTAVVTMVAAHAVMVLLMGITSLHMRNHDHTLADISIVFAAHTFGMFAFSLASGWLTDAWGRRPVLISGAALLIVACAAAPVSTALVPLIGALFALGLGWNLCYVGGSALLSDHLAPTERARTQGANDMLMGGTAALASFVSGGIFAVAGYAVMGVVGAVVSVLLLGWVVVVRPRVVQAG